MASTPPVGVLRRRHWRKGFRGISFLSSSLARMCSVSVVRSTRADSGCGPNLAGLFSSPFCHSGASCAWERGTARPQGGPSVGNAYCRVSAIAAQNLFQSCPSSTLSTSPTPSALPPILLPRGAYACLLYILLSASTLPKYSPMLCFFAPLGTAPVSHCWNVK